MNSCHGWLSWNEGIEDPSSHRISVEFEQGKNNPGVFDETEMKGWEVERDCRWGC